MLRVAVRKGEVAAANVRLGGQIGPFVRVQRVAVLPFVSAARCRSCRSFPAFTLFAATRAIADGAGASRVRVSDVEPQHAVIAQHAADVAEHVNERIDECVGRRFESDLRRHAVITEAPVNKADLSRHIELTRPPKVYARRLRLQSIAFISPPFDNCLEFLFPFVFLVLHLVVALIA